MLGCLALGDLLDRALDEGDAEGMSVLTAWAAGKFTASKIAQFIQESGIEKDIANKELIIPGYVAILSGPSFAKEMAAGMPTRIMPPGLFNASKTVTA